MNANCKSEKYIDDLINSTKKNITIIFITQTIFLAFTMFLLVYLNISNKIELSKNMTVVLNSALLGYLGSLIYFSRKSYVYLITNKIRNISEENKVGDDYDNASILSIMRGYYLYLIFRPFVGFIIGPVLYLFSMTGLFTFLKKSNEIENELSRSGRYVIYIISFLGGHTSSDVLDKFSRIVKNIVVTDKTNIDM